MTTNDLWDNHTFRVLLDDLYKARKDDALGPIRLEAVLNFIDPCKTQLVPRKPMVEPFKTPMQEGGVLPIHISKPRGVIEPKSEFTLEEDEVVPNGAKGQTFAEYADQMRAQRPDPNANLRHYAKIIMEQIKTPKERDGAGNVVVRLPRKAQTAGLEPMLKTEFGAIFTALQMSLPPKQQSFNAPKISAEGLDAFDASSSSESLGNRGMETDGWMITVVK